MAASWWWPFWKMQKGARQWSQDALQGTQKTDCASDQLYESAELLLLLALADWLSLDSNCWHTLHLSRCTAQFWQNLAPHLLQLPCTVCSHPLHTAR